MTIKDEMFMRDICFEFENIAKNSKELEIKSHCRKVKNEIYLYLDEKNKEKIRRKMKREMNSNKKITIPNAGTKLHIPCPKEVLLSREDMKRVKPEKTEWLIKTSIKEWIHSRIQIEGILEHYADKCGIILPSWKKYVV